MLSFYILFLSFLLFLSEKHEPLSKQTHGNGRENIRHGMLLDKGDRNTDHTAPDCNCNPNPLGDTLFPQPCGCDTQTIAHMEGRTDSRVGIHGVNESDQLRQNIVPGKYLRAQILTVGKDDIYRHSNDLGDDDIGLKFLETVHVVQQKV